MWCNSRERELVGVLSPVIHKGLYQGWRERERERERESLVWPTNWPPLGENSLTTGQTPGCPRDPQSFWPLPPALPPPPSFPLTTAVTPTLQYTSVQPAPAHWAPGLPTLAGLQGYRSVYREHDWFGKGRLDTVQALLAPIVVCEEERLDWGHWLYSVYCV